MMIQCAGILLNSYCNNDNKNIKQKTLSCECDVF